MLSGRITSADTGAPLVDAIVSTGAACAVTDANGRFALHGLAEGPHTLHLEKEGHMPTDAAAYEGEEHVELGMLAVAAPISLSAVRAERAHAAGHVAHEAGDAFAFRLWEYDETAVGLVEGEEKDSAPLVTVLLDPESGTGIAMTLESAQRLRDDLSTLLADPTIPETGPRA